MCSAPKIKAPPAAPPAPQEAHAPDTGVRGSGMGSGTYKRPTGRNGATASPFLLTGAGGVPTNAMLLGSSMLLGGGSK